MSVQPNGIDLGASRRVVRSWLVVRVDARHLGGFVNIADGESGSRRCRVRDWGSNRALGARRRTRQRLTLLTWVIRAEGGTIQQVQGRPVQPDASPDRVDLLQVVDSHVF
jgi:hypothetical protein